MPIAEKWEGVAVGPALKKGFGLFVGMDNDFSVTQTGEGEQLAVFVRPLKEVDAGVTCQLYAGGTYLTLAAGGGTGGNPEGRVSLVRKLRPRFWLTVVMPIAIASIVASVHGVMHATKLPRRQLKDRSWLELRDAKFGTNPELETRSGWRRLLPAGSPTVRYVQGAGLLWWGGPMWNSPNSYPPSSEPMLNVVVARTGLRRLTSYEAKYGVLTDEHGCWFEAQAEYRSHELDGTELVLLKFAPPCASKELSLGFYDSEGEETIDPFPVTPRLECGSEVKIGRPQALPISVTVANLRVTLLSLKHREVGLHRREAAHFRVKTLVGSAEDWRPTSIKVTDSTGTTADDTSLPWSSQHQTSSRKSPREVEVRFAGLCRRAPVWKLDVTFARMDGSNRGETREISFAVTP